MFFTGLVILGLVSLKDMEVNLFPKIDYPALSVVLETRDVDPTRIERDVVRLAEKFFSGITGIVSMTSEISSQGAVITLYFDWGENMDIKYIKVKERSLDLERELKSKIQKIRIKELGPISKPFMGIVFPDSISGFVKDEIATRINTLEGVGRTEVYYFKPREYDITIKPLTLINLPITPEKLIGLLKFPGGGVAGYIKAGRKVLPVNLESSFKDITGLNRFEIKNIELNRISKIEARGVEMSCYEGRERACALFVYPAGKGSFLKASKSIRKILEGYDVRYRILFDKSAFIKRSINSLLVALITGIILSWGILFIFLKNPVYATFVGVSIPVSVVSSFFIYRLFGIDMNIVTLGGLIVAAGMLVDASIVVIESISRYLSTDREKASLRGAEEVKSPVVAAILTNCVVFIPAIFVGGFPGRILRPFSIVLIGSLLFSLLVALTLVPAFSSYLKLPAPARENEGISSKVADWAGVLMKKKFLTSGVAILLFFTSIYFIRYVKFEPFPTESTGNLKFHVVPFRNVSDKEILEKLSLLKIPFLLVHSRSGKDYFDVYFENVRDYDGLVSKIRELFPDFYMYMEEFDNPEEDLKFHTLRLPERRYHEIVELKLDPEKMSYLGISPARFKTLLKAAIEGVKLFEINDKVVYLRGSCRNIDDLLNYPVKKDSTVFKLGEFVDVERKLIPSFVIRQNGRRVKYITLKRERHTGDLVMALLVSIILVYLVLAGQYNSMLLPLLVMFSLPLSLVPAVPVLILTGERLNVMGIVGLIVLAGIAGNNAIILLDYTLRLISEGHNSEEALLLAVKRRVRPIMMTTLTTILAMLPLALGVGPAGKMESSMAHLLIAGLVFSAFSAIFILPSIYSILLRNENP